MGWFRRSKPAGPFELAAEAIRNHKGPLVVLDRGGSLRATTRGDRLADGPILAVDWTVPAKARSPLDSPAYVCWNPLSRAELPGTPLRMDHFMRMAEVLAPGTSQKARTWIALSMALDVSDVEVGRAHDESPDMALWPIDESSLQSVAHDMMCSKWARGDGDYPSVRMRRKLDAINDRTHEDSRRHGGHHASSLRLALDAMDADGPDQAWESMAEAMAAMARYADGAVTGTTMSTDFAFADLAERGPDKARTIYVEVPFAGDATKGIPALAEIQATQMLAAIPDLAVVAHPQWRRVGGLDPWERGTHPPLDTPCEFPSETVREKSAANLAASFQGVKRRRRIQRAREDGRISMLLAPSDFESFGLERKWGVVPAELVKFKDPSKGVSVTARGDPSFFDDPVEAALAVGGGMFAVWSEWEFEALRSKLPGDIPLFTDKELAHFLRDMAQPHVKGELTTLRAFSAEVMGRTEPTRNTPEGAAARARDVADWIFRRHN